MTRPTLSPDSATEPSTEAIRAFLDKLRHTDPEILVWIRSLLGDREARAASVPPALDVDVIEDIIMGEPWWPRMGAIRRRAVMDKIRAAWAAETPDLGLDQEQIDTGGMP